MSLQKRIRQVWRNSLQDNAVLWRSGLHGFERELFRLDASTGIPAATTHKQLFAEHKQYQQVQQFYGNEYEKLRLGELLPHALTLDFSDQQIELVSKPHREIEQAEADISLLLRFVAGELKQQKYSEILWAFSQPPLFGPEGLDAIRIADFSNTLNAEDKEAYRKQLLLRYGKAKQSWTSIHYNFSFDLRLFHELEISPCETYAYLARNLWRNFWLIELLFGCTPSLSDFYIEQVQKHFAKGGIKTTTPSAHATSLHSNSEYGYRSFEQQLQYLDYSTPKAYWQSIQNIAQTESDFFRNLGLDNTNLIQDSRELYIPFRLKQLQTHGNESWYEKSHLVDYLELRILDIDPFFNDDSYSGIYSPSIYLAHLLILHSTIIEAPPLDTNELLRCAKYEQYVVNQGRKPSKELQENAYKLLEELGELSSLLGFSQNYFNAIQNAKQILREGRFRSVEFVQQFNMEPNHLLTYSREWTELLQSK